MFKKKKEKEKEDGGLKSGVKNVAAGGTKAVIGTAQGISSTRAYEKKAAADKIKTGLDQVDKGLSQIRKHRRKQYGQQRLHGGLLSADVSLVTVGFESHWAKAAHLPRKPATFAL